MATNINVDLTPADMKLLDKIKAQLRAEFGTATTAAAIRMAIRKAAK